MTTPGCRRRGDLDTIRPGTIDDRNHTRIVVDDEPPAGSFAAADEPDHHRCGRDQEDGDEQSDLTHQPKAGRATRGTGVVTAAIVRGGTPGGEHVR